MCNEGDLFIRDMTHHYDRKYGDYNMIIYDGTNFIRVVGCVTGVLKKIETIFDINNYTYIGNVDSIYLEALTQGLLKND